MARLPPLSALRAFEAVARLGSMTRAAAELHLTHSAISHQIRAMEDELEVLLFLRQGKRLQLTDAGRLYAMQVRHALGAIASATEELVTRPKPHQLAVGTLASFTSHWLLSRLPDLLRRHPTLQVQLHTAPGFSDLNLERLDCAVRMGQGGWDGVHQELLFRDQQLVVASPGFAGGALPKTVAEVHAARRIAGGGVSWRVWFDHAGVTGPELPCSLWINDANSVVEAVLQGQAVGLIRRSLAHDLLQSGRLVPLPGPVIDYPDPYWLIWPQRSEGLEKFLLWRDWLHRVVAGYLAGLSEN
ncbi:MAG TPA: LysR substrate-binding domain-containing protein [Chitinolyticbacter sp.]|nr:LysR substrate-binding domain-containing protein [Chitinolyticbacter sp.]